MAEHQPSSDFGDGPDQVSVTRVAQWGGAIISVALILGMAFWAYRIIIRDVSGIPVVQAADGPLRIQPEDPGGRQADHQGFAVNDVVSDGTASPSAQTLILAPDPQELSTDDAPFGELPLGTGSTGAVLPIGQATTDDEQRDAVLGLADQMIAEQQSEAVTGNDAILLAVLEAASTADAEGAPSSAPFPQLRPALTTTTQVASNSLVRDVAPSAVPDGSRLVQLGAFQSDAVARSEWERMSKLFPGYLDDKARVIQQAESGGKTFYRLRALGFEDIEDARRFCAAFKSRNVDCVPVLVR
ncbi:MAG: SPOR domain-containing protein [Paracoccaceae bacterium]|jgi:hypothetical protein|nr:SPOR domain-containing protein [Paracoccaceae bacterium]